MCDVDGCAAEPVVLVDVTFPSDVEIDASDEGGSFPNPVGSQRVGLCVLHAAEQDLNTPLVTARAVKGHKAKGRFPTSHALAADWSWTVS
jgi:hypothetical protein